MFLCSLGPKPDRELMGPLETPHTQDQEAQIEGWIDCCHWRVLGDGHPWIVPAVHLPLKKSGSCCGKAQGWSHWILMKHETCIKWKLKHKFQTRYFYCIHVLIKIRVKEPLFSFYCLILIQQLRLNIHVNFIHMFKSIFSAQGSNYLYPFL